MPKTSRRVFLQRTVGSAGAILYLYAGGGYQIVTAGSGSEAYRLRIVHTNDHHARIEPQTITIKSGSPSSTRNFGGVTRRITKIKQIRQEVTAASDPLAKNLLVLDAGDVFQGTLYFNQYSGKADLAFYNQIQYDAVGVGNHEFDKGDQLLAEFVQGAQFPMVSANIVASSGPLQPLISATPAGPGKISPYIIKTIGGQKIGIFGLTTQETKTGSSPGPNTDFADPIQTATAQVAALKAAGANKIIGLTHIGYVLDLQLASQVADIDIIVGGHSHTPLQPSAGLGPVGIASAGPYPTIVQDPNGKDVVIVTDWEYGKWLGDITISFNSAGEVLSATGNLQPVWADGVVFGTTPPTPRSLLPGEGEAIMEDADAVTLLGNYKPAIDALQMQKIGSTAVLLNGGSAFRTRETNLGDLIADAMRDKVAQYPEDNPDNLPLVTIMNSGGIRTNINVGDVTVGNVREVLPFDNTLARVDVTGAQLVAALENGVSQVELTAGRFPQVSGLRFTWLRYGTPAKQATPANQTSPATPGQKGSRISKVEILIGSAYQPLDPQKLYRVITNDFMVKGGDGYNAFTTQGDQADPSVGGAKNQNIPGFILADVVQDYIAAHSPVNVATNGRITAMSKILMPLINAPIASAK